jgi:hypothetical protein
MVLLGNSPAHHAISERMTFAVGVMEQVTSKKLMKKVATFRNSKGN